MPAPALLETHSDDVLRDKCNTCTGQDSTSRTENTSGASNQMHFRFIAREVDIPVVSQRLTFQWRHETRTSHSREL